ncbi:flippase, partial [Bacteroides thetaiotaomicron]|nr:flippase [Bacteroides thetaiotaomicron]
GGIISLYEIVYKMNIKLIKPSLNSAMIYLKDSSSIFATDLVCTIKDKLSYLLVGTFVGMSDVVIYDLGLKLHGIAAKPYMLICTVMFPRLAKNKNIRQLKLIMLISFFLTLAIIVVANVFLEKIVIFFLHEECDLFPLRLFLVGPLVLSVSYVISNNLFVAFGYNKYMFISILVTTFVYVLCLITVFITGHMNTVMSFISIALISYSAELVYRLLMAKKIISKEKSKKIHEDVITYS